MRAPTDRAESEVLEQGEPSLAFGRGRARVVLLAVLVLVLAAGGVDWQVRRHEGDHLARCVDAATVAVAVADARVNAMTSYVRPALAASPPPRLRRQLLAMISQEAVPATASVQQARDLCRAVDVLPVHTTLRATRADCVRLLAAQLDYLRAVRADGGQTFEAGAVPLRGGSCSPRPGLRPAASR